MNSGPQVTTVREREAGFTLIELLVSLTIVGVILGLLSTGLRVLSQNTDARSERIDTIDMISRAADIFARDTTGLQRIFQVGKDGSPRFIFSGRSDGMAFITVEPPYPSTPGLYFVSYSIARNGPDNELIRARAPYEYGMNVFPGATPANKVKLMQGGYAYRFSYAAKTAARAEWRPVWPASTRLPDLIRLEVVDVRRNAPAAPAIVVAVAADAEINCLEDEPAVCSPKTGGEIKTVEKAQIGGRRPKQ